MRKKYEMPSEMPRSKNTTEKWTRIKEKVNKAKEKVDELNFRFSDWYYVVSENEYRKIHLGRSDVVKGKVATEEQGSDIDAFRLLQESGLEKDSNQ